MQPWFTAYIPGAEHPCYCQLTPAKTRYPSTGILLPHRGINLLKLGAPRLGLAKSIYN